MITGYNRRTAEAVSGELGIEHVFAEVLPADKARYVWQLQAEGKRVAVPCSIIPTLVDALFDPARHRIQRFVDGFLRPRGGHSTGHPEETEPS